MKQNPAEAIPGKSGPYRESAKPEPPHDQKLRDAWESKFSGKTFQEIEETATKEGMFLQVKVPADHSEKKGFKFDIDFGEMRRKDIESELYREKKEKKINYKDLGVITFARHTEEVQNESTREMLRLAYELKDRAMEKGKDLMVRTINQTEGYHEKMEKGGVAKLFAFIQDKKQYEALVELWRETNSKKIRFSDFTFKDKVEEIVKADLSGLAPEQIERRMEELKDAIGEFEAQLDKFEKRFSELTK